MNTDTLRHDRLMRLPPVLRAGFRPFFLGSACWALAVIILWVMSLSGRARLPTYMDALTWHRHEMLFGFIGAAIAGFLLTAIPNWTGRLPITGVRLAALFALWLAARLTLLFSAYLGAWPAVVLDIAFPSALAFVAAREILAARNRNYPLILAALLFAAANGLDHAEALGQTVPTGLGWRAGTAIILMLMSMIGGRIIPSFTRNWLAAIGRQDFFPDLPMRFDIMTLAVTAGALAGWAAAPASEFSGGMLLGAAVLQAIRLSRWSGQRTVGNPLLFILHISYLWLVAGLLLLGGSAFIWCIPLSSALHALTAGAMASMTLAVMTRAALGHTGRELRADGWTKMIYSFVTLGAILRFAAPMLPFNYAASIAVSGALWGASFLIYLLSYGPKLLTSRPDGKP